MEPKKKKLIVPSLDKMLTKAPRKKRKEEIIVNHIEALMQKKKMIQVELAHKSFIDSGHLNKIMRMKKRSISLPIAMKIARALGEPVEKVFEIK